MDIVSDFISVGDKTAEDNTTLTGICMKSGNSQQAEMVPVDLQWFVIYCDKTRPESDQCTDMYDSSRKLQKISAVYCKYELLATKKARLNTTTMR